ncbi:M20 family metallopeptidase [Agrobacterium rhizogenes]|uniref:M20 metallopeptidase family protein n=1 Tax=Rhizobium rhizogenes TaxID=359 RepID=UPI0022B7027B|nr:M20 family metallopeptidase [Rhizobium rhizogenes]MCZ7450884.1 M20 family metallopeptidase [Rhizobium rhizogenes]
MSSDHLNLQLLNDLGPRISELVSDIESRLIEIRRDLHAHPELGFETTRTAQIVADELTAMGLEVKTGVGRSGVVAEIAGQYPGPCVIIRADMDALPIEEATGLPFASTVKGSMHACGHDLHTASLLGAANALSVLKPRLHGNVRLVFQPAEEIADSGAAAMIRDGAAEGGDFAIGFHNMPHLPAGQVQLTLGASTASSDEFKVVVRGVSGHAARPHLAEDPIVAAAYMIAQLQTVVSRQVDPANSAVLTVGLIHGGRTQNIIPDACIFEGTVRCRSPQTRDIAEESFRRICNGAAQASNVTVDIDYVRGVPGVMNDEALVTRATEAFTQQFGEAPLVEVSQDFGGEDFAYFSERMPALHINIGSSQSGRADRLHNSDYQPDEDCIAKSAVALTRMAVELLS